MRRNVDGLTDFRVERILQLISELRSFVLVERDRGNGSAKHLKITLTLRGMSICHFGIARNICMLIVSQSRQSTHGISLMCNFVFTILQPIWFAFEVTVLIQRVLTLTASRNSNRNENRQLQPMELNVFSSCVLVNIFDIFDSCALWWTDDAKNSKLNNNFLVYKYIIDTRLPFYTSKYSAFKRIRCHSPILQAVFVVFTRFGEYFFGFVSDVQASWAVRENWSKCVVMQDSDKNESCSIIIIIISSRITARPCAS